jgi:hypothetical protein
MIDTGNCAMVAGILFEVHESTLLQRRFWLGEIEVS